jgi:hypothetical protein
MIAEAHEREVTTGPKRYEDEVVDENTFRDNGFVRRDANGTRGWRF